MSLIYASATELARRLRNRDLSPVAVLQAHLERIEAVNPAINAMVHRRYDDAMAEAVAAERRLADGGTGDLPPLFGVPCSIKSAFGVAGYPWDSGISSRQGLIAQRDAVAVARLRAAGAIVMGMTNVPEGLMWFETYNALHGRTCNPYDTSRLAGGSSGGEGALIAAGGAPFGLGSDVAGSIRLPSFFCGIFGHKPSGGRVCCDGQYPPTAGKRARILASGPMTRRAEDLLPLMRVLEDPDWRAERGEGDHRLRDLPAVAGGDLRGVRVYVAETNGRIPVHRDMKRAIVAAGEALEKCGAVVEHWRHPALAGSLELWLATIDETSGWTFSQILGSGDAVPLGRELARKAVRRSPHILPSLALVAMEKATAGKASAMMARLAEDARALKRDLDQRLGDDGVLLHPPFPRVAMKHRRALLRPYECAYTAIFNALRLPSTQTPLGLDRRGLPLGTQVVGAEGCDALCMAVARALEGEFGGWVMPQLP